MTGKSHPQAPRKENPRAGEEPAAAPAGAGGERPRQVLPSAAPVAPQPAGEAGGERWPGACVGGGRRGGTHLPLAVVAGARGGGGLAAAAQHGDVQGEQEQPQQQQ